MKSIGIFVFFLFLNGLVFSQKLTQEDIIEKEQLLYNHFEDLKTTKNDSLKLLINDKIIQLFEIIYSTNQCFKHDFESLEKISKLRSSNKLVRIISWNIPLSDGTYKYFGFIQYKSKKQKKIIVYPLLDKSDEIENPDIKELSPNNWYGALYYQIVVFKHKKNTYYVLLGWDGNNLQTNKKIIEILHFNKSAEPVFGMNLKFEKRFVKRVIFEYSKKNQMNLRYDEKYKIIVFDHLVPSDPKLVGQFQYYGPDLTFDALYFNNGIWEFIQGVDVRNQEVKTKVKKQKYSY